MEVIVVVGKWVAHWHRIKQGAGGTDLGFVGHIARLVTGVLARGKLVSH